MTLAVSEPLVDVARRLLVRGDDGGPPINRNDVGFSASDYGMVRRVVNVIDRSGRVSDFDRRILGGVLRKYRRQMSELGFDPADVLATVPEQDGPVPVRDVIPHAVADVAHAIAEEIDVADALRTDPEGFLSGLDGIAEEMVASLERATQPAGARSVWEDDERTPAPRKPLRPIPAITTVLGPNGLVAKSLPGYEPRYPQIKLSQAIADAISKDQSVLAEAGTGVGKSIAYLIPLIYSGAKVIVSTEGKALQDQLANKDLPYLQNTLPVRFTFAKLKGISNYLCLRDLNDEASQRGLLGDTEEWTAFNAWLDRGADTEGDMADSPLRPGSELRPRVTTSSEDCTGRDCAFYDRCYAQRAKQKAKDADVVVVNHALLCLDIALRGRTDDGVSILPDRRIVVIDEVHALPSVAVASFTVELSNWTVPTLCRGKLPAQAGLDPEQLKAATDASAEFFAAIGALVERERGTTTVVRPTPGQQRLAVAVAGALRPLVRGVERAASGETLGMAESSRLSRYAERITEAAERFEGLMAETGGTHVLYAEQETGKKGSVTTRLALAPVSVADDLHAALWSKWPVVATSATITAPAAGGRGRRGSPFDFFRDESGVKDAREVVVESPFDYQNNALIYTPADADSFDPSAYRLDGTDAYFDRLTDRILDLLEASDGRAFVLFTSRRALNEVRDRVLRHRGLPWTTFFQGDAAPQELVRRFKDDGHAILYGTRTFWTGVDVQGDALSQVILDKLPFPSPEEPVYQAKCDKLTEDTGDKWAWFNRLAIPNATITFKQGIGRLIRTGSDRGVMSLLDGRLSTKGYGAKVLDYLPRARRTSSIEDVRAFFRERRG